MPKIDIKGVIVSNDDKWIYDWFEVDAVSPREITNQIAESNGEDLEIEINSPGGDVYAGSEIYTALMQHKGNVIVKIVGVAASAASVIAMAGKKVLISPTAQLMIHNVSTCVFGDSQVFAHEADVLKGHNQGIANAYMLKTGIDQKKLLEMMNKETYFNAQQALENKFVDEIMFSDPTKMSASIKNFVIPEKIVNKMRNHLKPISNETPNKDIVKAQAKLNFLKLKGAQNNE
jgi:ATP-dependent protease ClpP protease subunit